MTRRTFVKTTAAAIVGSAAMPTFAGLTGQSLRILFLGGTGFLGPHMVRDAIGRSGSTTDP